MLFKLSLSNLRKSIKDYAIYFFTLIIGVAVFYVFNSVGTQAAYMNVASSRNDIVVLFKNMLSALSVFVAGVLGLLIAYASRFLMKRRSREFALYMLLGMGRRKISAILLTETIIIGLGSLATGLIAGIGLSQLMSALVASLFEADMTAYKFMVSGEAIVKTIIFFGVMYVVVMMFNAVVISRCKLIDLIQAGRKSEKLKAHNPWLCSVVFIVAAVALGIAYYQVGYNPGFFAGGDDISRGRFIACVLTGCVSTFLIIWSVSGLLLRIVMSIKNRYYSGLNSFTFRQLSSKVNTMVFSMTVICLMLFVTISALAASFSLRSSMNGNIRTLCPADFEFRYSRLEGDVPVKADFAEDCKEVGVMLTDNFEDYVSIYTYYDENLTYKATLGDNAEAVTDRFRFIIWDSPETIVKLSEYNSLMDLFGRERLTMADDEYIMLCNFANMKDIRDFALRSGSRITVYGHELKPKYDECQDGFIELTSQPLNPGIVVIPDSVANEDMAYTNFLVGNYKAETKDEKKIVEARVKNDIELFNKRVEPMAVAKNLSFVMDTTTKFDISEATVGLTAIITFMGLYIGLVFLISCGAILALKELSDSADSVPRYEILRKIGVEEKDISRSLFVQTGIFFLLPLLLGTLHSVFGLKFALNIFEVLGMDKLAGPIAATSVIIVLIYGGYFLITYASDRAIIRAQS
ncbi:MAG: FtsX-like permease family protein [Lachnospiraceae bacterium]|nr:FtsX-like permease family protein [Lachnospiraceae bacterium]